MKCGIGKEPFRRPTENKAAVLKKILFLKYIWPLVKNA